MKLAIKEFLNRGIELEAIYLHCFSIYNAFHAEKHGEILGNYKKSHLSVLKDQTTLHETPPLF